MFNTIVLPFICMLQLQLVATEGQRGTNRPVFYAVEMDGGVRAARDLAEHHGLEFISRIGSLENVYSLRDSRENPDQACMETQLQHAAEVIWVQRQQGFHRDKRVSIAQLDTSQVHGPPRQQNVTDRRSKKRKKLTDYSTLTFNDPLWPLQWELFAQGSYRPSSLDLNVMPVWLKNITGNGVVVSIIDDGLDYTNNDLKINFEALASVDLLSSHGVSHDPMPIRDEENGHGTHCAGEIAMEANNSYCGVGIAFNARIGGIRLLGGQVTDAMEATALSFSPDVIHVYVCSWGPPDNGSVLGGPGLLTQLALQSGAHKGRHGRGSVYVWASGNGGIQHDHCGADGYVNSVYTIAVGAVTHTGAPASYGEPCPATMAVTPTGANPKGSLPLVTVSNLEDGCRTRFPGTSSAAPYAAGILALVLEANPELTWRDVQHLIARTARIPDPSEPGWMINGAGYHVHHRYGFGVLDAGLMVQQALLYNTTSSSASPFSSTSTAPHHTCSLEVPLREGMVIPTLGTVNLSIPSDGCRGSQGEVNSLEHVQVRVNISSVCRGDLSIGLLSPAGTVSTLLDVRPNDASKAGLTDWTLMTLHCWGERAQGLWTLQVTDHRGTAAGCVRDQKVDEAAGVVLSVTLVLYGTQPPNEAPLGTVVSLGSHHPVPQAELHAGGPSAAPLEVIQWAYQLETEGRVCAEDIPDPPRPERTKESTHPSLDLTYLHADDTDLVKTRAELPEIHNAVEDGAAGGGGGMVEA